MIGCFHLRCAAAHLTLGRNQFHGVDQLLTFVALITASVVELTRRIGTRARYVTIGQESLAGVAVQLIDALLRDQTSLVQFPEDILANFRLFLRRCSTEEIEVQLKPFVDLRVQIVVLVADLSRRALLLERFRLRRRTVLIRTADVHRIVISRSAVPKRSRAWDECVREAVEILPSEHITTEQGSNQVAQVRYVVDVRERTGDQHVARTVFRRSVKEE